METAKQMRPMPQQLFCSHHWSTFFEVFNEHERRFKTCRSLCQHTWYEDDPEPRVVLATLE